MQTSHQNALDSYLNAASNLYVYMVLKIYMVLSYKQFIHDIKVWTICMVVRYGQYTWY